jgi:hypothetical protein
MAWIAAHQQSLGNGEGRFASASLEEVGGAGRSWHSTQPTSGVVADRHKQPSEAMSFRRHIGLVCIFSQKERREQS